MHGRATHTVALAVAQREVAPEPRQAGKSAKSQRQPPEVSQGASAPQGVCGWGMGKRGVPCWLRRRCPAALLPIHWQPTAAPPRARPAAAVGQAGASGGAGAGAGGAELRARVAQVLGGRAGRAAGRAARLDAGRWCGSSTASAPHAAPACPFPSLPLLVQAGRRGSALWAHGSTRSPRTCRCPGSRGWGWRRCRCRPAASRQDARGGVGDLYSAECTRKAGPGMSPGPNQPCSCPERRWGSRPWGPGPPSLRSSWGGA